MTPCPHAVEVWPLKIIGDDQCPLPQGRSPGSCRNDCPKNPSPGEWPPRNPAEAHIQRQEQPCAGCGG